jgi:hypothetical protein
LGSLSFENCALGSKFLGLDCACVQHFWLL